jgi:hypothetical protein
MAVNVKDTNMIVKFAGEGELTIVKYINLLIHLGKEKFRIP